MTLYLIPDGRLNGPRVKRRQKTMKRLFLAADKLLTLKYYVGVDTESSVHSPQHSKEVEMASCNTHDMKPIEEMNEEQVEIGDGMYLPSMETVNNDHNEEYHQKRNSTRL